MLKADQIPVNKIQCTCQHTLENIKYRDYSGNFKNVNLSLW